MSYMPKKVLPGNRSVNGVQRCKEKGSSMIIHEACMIDEGSRHAVCEKKEEGWEGRGAGPWQGRHTQ